MRPFAITMSPPHPPQWVRNKPGDKNPEVTQWVRDKPGDKNLEVTQWVRDKDIKDIRRYS